MKPGDKSVSEHELQAYVDGELDARRRLQIEAWLATHPDAADRLQDYRQIQTQLHARFDSILAQGSDVHVPARPVSLAGFSRVAAVAALMLISGLLGWVLKPDPQLIATGPVMNDLVQPAAFAHQVYSTDIRYPVEIAAAEQASLNRWLSQRMHTDLRAPDLSHENLKFLGGRLLPSTNRMAAQFMYEDTQGQRLTVYVRRVNDPAGVSEFRYREQGDLHVFYWIDGEMGYAVVGTQPASRLVTVASAVQTVFR
ncbi:anti-sigma factor RsiW [Thiogranum longum]|uniref:Anti-sigma factor RsiW n=1 Tax=Thiogranum longum TaxID=1537524 RepID=A0A4R1HE69_9GAMM|nr:anti-sigma factor [Thiogranum longum]TCK19021.1 anti-sigma factor RsiW [Thiogranum longum]